MRLWKIAVVGIFYFLSSFFNEAIGQKKWDGEAGDGSWGSERNWYPDGVPDSSSTVIFDNAILRSSYTVIISSDTSPVKLHNLIIQPSAGNSIILEIPKSNKAVPALSLFSNKLSIAICKGGILINKSSAVAGNTILMSGRIRIEDGGKYSHQSLRGNAYIMTKLESSSGTERGIVEFDVPGTSSYPISMSGRQYGSLWLFTSNKEKRTYTGSGNNELTIRGNLIIDDSVNFNSSLTGNIIVAGNIDNKGTLSINPSSVDSVNRELVFIGDSSVYSSSGTLLLGEKFNGIRLKKGVLHLRSSIQVVRPTSSFLVDRYTRLMMDTFYIYGNGQFKADSNSVIGIGSPDGISIHTGKGNVRTSYKDISPKTSYIFYGDQDQVTGSAFPLSVSNVEINKTKGILRLSSQLTITDSLILSKGILNSSASEPLELLGIAYSTAINQYGWHCGSDSSFIDGPIRLRLNNSSNAIFPAGKGRLFVPLKINIRNATNKTIEVEYVDTLRVVPNNILPPLKMVSKKGYWKVITIADQDTMSQKASVQLGVKSQQYDSLLNPPLIAIADSIVSNWKIIENYSYDQASNTATGTISLKRSLLALGSMQEEILSAKRIDLTYRKNNDHSATLRWISYGNLKLKELNLEKSVDGIKFVKIFQIINHSDLNTQDLYEKIILLDDHLENHFRIVCIEDPYSRIISNTVCIRNQKKIDYPFPNPAVDEIMIKLSGNDEERILSIHVIDNTGKTMRVNASVFEKLVRLNTSMLKKGLYQLKIETDREKRIYPFMKN